MTVSHLLWDFNGTILDDVQAGIDSVNVLLRRRDLREIPDAAYYRTVFDFPIIDYYRRLGFDFDREPYATLADEWVEQYLFHAAHAPMRQGVRTLLDACRDAGIEQLVLFATQHRMLEMQLEQLGIRDYFTEILGLDNIYAASKVHLAEAWKKRVQPEHALLIGDTVHDYAVAQAAGISCVLVTGGHQSAEKLATCGVPVLKTFDAALDYIVG